MPRPGSSAITCLLLSLLILLSGSNGHAQKKPPAKVEKAKPQTYRFDVIAQVGKVLDGRKILNLKPFELMGVMDTVPALSSGIALDDNGDIAFSANTDKGPTIFLNGKAVAYKGMPLAGVKVLNVGRPMLSNQGNLCYRISYLAGPDAPAAWGVVIDGAIRYHTRDNNAVPESDLPSHLTDPVMDSQGSYTVVAQWGDGDHLVVDGVDKGPGSANNYYDQFNKIPPGAASNGDIITVVGSNPTYVYKYSATGKYTPVRSILTVPDFGDGNKSGMITVETQYLILNNKGQFAFVFDGMSSAVTEHKSCQAIILATPITGQQPPPEKARAFFYICYLNREHALPKYQSFPDAAATWEREIKARYSFKPGRDKFIEAYVRTASDFVTTWNDINQTVSQGNYAIVAGGLFTHSSLPLGSHGFVLETGLEFGGEPGVSAPAAGSTLTRDMIRVLPKLNWDEKGKLELFGCNTGRIREFDWCPASAFASAQHVTTTGEMGFAYFSQDKEKYITITTGSKQVYLRAYMKGYNQMFDYPNTGQRIPPSIFVP